jgi:DNA-binding IclR family transcriptional regulator
VDGTDHSALGSRQWPVRVKRPGDRRSLSRSATRALDVLELFGRVRRPLRAVEIARALDLHPSTTNQLLKTMVESAHLTFEAAAKSYLPSSRLARFAGWMVESYGADERLRRLVRDLQAATGETVTLTTPNDLFMQVVELAGPPGRAEGAERGLRVSIFGTASGAAHLSTLPETEILRLAIRARIAPAEHAALIANAARVRRDGAADGPSPDGMIWSAAAPLPDVAAPSPLVLGLAGPVARMKPEIQALKALMRGVIVAAGFTDPSRG